MTVSRSAILGLIVVAIVLIPTWPKYDRRIAYAAIFIFLATAAVAIHGLLRTFLSLFNNQGSAQASTQSRESAFASAAPFIAQHPWFGLGFGYEWLSASITGPSATTGQNVTLSSGVAGWEFINLQGGADFRLLNGTLGVGPMVSFAISQYDHVSSSSDNNGGTTGSSIPSQALHEWFLIGARGNYDLKF